MTQMLKPVQPSLRDMFASRAPTEPPSWFQIPDAATVPDLLDADEALTQDEGWATLTESQRMLLRKWMRDPALKLDDRAAEALFEEIGERVLARIEQQESDREHAIQHNLIERYFAWRWFYADQMLFWRSADRNVMA